MDTHRQEVIAEIAEPLLDLADSIAALESRIADAIDKGKYRRNGVLSQRLMDADARWHNAIASIRERDGEEVAIEVHNYVHSRKR